MRILLQRTWNHNIGNGFLAKGALATLEQAFPDAEIVELGLYGRFVSQKRYSPVRKLAAPLGQGLDKNEVNRSKFFASVNPDLVVLPGPILDTSAYRIFEPTLKAAHESETPIFLLGTGSPSYTDETQSYIREMFDRYPPAAMVTRNPLAYKLYADDIERSYDGVDNAFFIDEWFDPVRVGEKYTTLTFDKRNEPDIQTSGTVIRPQHRPYRPYIISLIDRIKRKFSVGWKMVRYDDPNWFFSDGLEDYLFVYANSETAHTDRIHAAVPTIVYGNRAKLYLDSPRAKILEKDFVEHEDGFLKVNESALAEAKNRQTETLHQFWEDVQNND